MITQSVLIIDDSEDVHALLDVRLRGESLRLYHASNPTQGLDIAARLHPDVILLDLEMPEMDGFTVCQHLKADPSTAQIPVVFLTGANDVLAKVRGFDVGGVDYVTKPFDPVELRARVRATLRTKRYQDMLSARAQLDALTGLRNRSYFEQRVAEEVAAAVRYKRDVCLVMMDIDHFKSLNDNHGHPFGDLVLQRTGELLLNRCRATDAGCRYGGEEFAIILTETKPDGALHFCERLRSEFAAMKLRAADGYVKVTASFGISYAAEVARRQALTVRSLVEIADEALYSAKRSGRDRVVLAEARRAEKPA
jgi:diguanylate cyclase (GGDEF)-like protein